VDSGIGSRNQALSQLCAFVSPFSMSMSDIEIYQQSQHVHEVKASFFEAKSRVEHRVQMDFFVSRWWGSEVELSIPNSIQFDNQSPVHRNSVTKASRLRWSVSFC
jgi:hypothetical protein